MNGPDDLVRRSDVLRLLRGDREGCQCHGKNVVQMTTYLPAADVAEPRKVCSRPLWEALDILSDRHETLNAPAGRKWLPCGSSADPCPDFACVQAGMNVVSTLCGDCDARRLSGEPCSCDCSPCVEPNHARHALPGCCAVEAVSR